MRAVVVGGINVDLHLQLPHLPRVGETVLGGDLVRLPGGKGGNQAVALARLDATVELVGAVGDDEDGRWSTAQLAAAGVGTQHVRTVAAPTGRAVVLVDGLGDNAIAVAAGANGAVTAADVRAAAPAIATADVLVTSLEVPAEAASTAVAAAADAGIRCVLNAAPWHGDPPPAWPGLDAVVVNAGELTAFGLGSDVDGVRRALGARMLVATAGAAGADVSADGLGAAVHVPAPPVHVVDSTGAGDCFTAALAAALCDGTDAVTAVEFASTAAAMSVESRGARTAPDRKSVTGRLPAPGARRAPGQHATPTMSELDR